VGAIIGGLADSVADEVRLREAHAAAITEQRLTALVALVAPWALLLLTAATNPQARLLYGTPTGGVVIAIGVVATVAGYVITHRTLRLTRMPRTFR
ncbi:MAG: hypothetical protein KJN71_07965, partial [Acidimicrobiia bacterium]|nr:hypothetical protein [Acidimicrobiia bacterium]